MHPPLPYRPFRVTRDSLALNVLHDSRRFPVSRGGGAFCSGYSPPHTLNCFILILRLPVSTLLVNAYLHVMGNKKKNHAT